MRPSAESLRVLEGHQHVVIAVFSESMLRRGLYKAFFVLDNAKKLKIIIIIINRRPCAVLSFRPSDGNIGKFKVKLKRFRINLEKSVSIVDGSSIIVKKFLLPAQKLNDSRY
jgi:hypothetical protein